MQVQDNTLRAAPVTTAMDEILTDDFCPGRTVVSAQEYKAAKYPECILWPGAAQLGGAEGTQQRLHENGACRIKDSNEDR